jgi:hypothetical protein
MWSSTSSHTLVFMAPCLIKITLTTLWSEQLRTSDVEFAILCWGREVLLSMYSVQYTGVEFHGIRPASAHPLLCSRVIPTFTQKDGWIFKNPCYLYLGNRTFMAEMLIMQKYWRLFVRFIIDIYSRIKTKSTKRCSPVMYSNTQTFGSDGISYVLRKISGRWPNLNQISFVGIISPYPPLSFIFIISLFLNFF